MAKLSDKVFLVCTTVNEPLINDKLNLVFPPGFLWLLQIVNDLCHCAFLYRLHLHSRDTSITILRKWKTV